MLAAAAPAPLDANPPLPRLVDVRFDRKPTSTRVVFEFSSLPFYRTFDEQVSRGYVYLDFYEVNVAGERQGEARGDGTRLTGIARRPFPESRTLRVILGTDRVRPVLVQTLERPARVVVDFYDHGAVPANAPNEPWRLTPSAAATAVAPSPRATQAMGASSPDAGRGDAPPVIAFASSSHYAAAPIRFHASSGRASRPLRVVVDPGHGGHDPGALSRLKFGGRAAQEKDLALAVSRELKALADADPDIEVILTRTTDKYMSLQDRVAFAEAQRADLFLSVHLNSAPQGSGTARGCEFFTLNPKGQGQLAARIVRSMSTNQSASPTAASTRLVERMAKDRVQRLVADSTAAARALDAAFGADPFFRTRNRGPKTANFYVLKNATCPTVLVEVGFMTDSDDVRRLRDQRHQREAAALMLRAVKSWARQRA